MNESVFRQPVPKSGILLKQRVWNATPEGKDASRGDLRLVANADALWISNVISIPLPWFSAFEPVGPGFRLRWLNKIVGKEEAAIFCIRTFFGYDTGRRDTLIKELADLAARATGTAPSSGTASAESPRCEKCGAPATNLLDLPRITNFLVYWISRTDRRVLCDIHARSAIRSNALRNSVTGTIGVPGAIVTPLTVWRTAAALSPGERFALFALAALPGALLLGVVLWGIASNL